MRNLKTELVLLLAASVAIASGCRTTTETVTTTSSGNGTGQVTTETRTSVQTNAPADANPQETINAALKNIEQQKSWTAVMETTVKDMPQANSKSTVSYSAPSDFRIVTEGSTGTLEIRTIGGESFILSNKKWQKAPASMDIGRMITNFRQMFSKMKTDAFRNVQSLGNETVNGQQVAVYSYEIDAEAAMPEEMKEKMTDEMRKNMADAKIENRTKLYLDTAKNLPVKVDMITKMKQPKETEQNVVMTYDFSKPVVIEKPKL